MYDLDPHLADLYDQIETYTDDVDLVRQLIRGPQRILEPFCGTGRISLPLACAGHILTGIDQAKSMLDRARLKIALLPVPVQPRITLIQADVLQTPWPQGVDVVILGANCFYELATPDDQRACITRAAEALVPGGYVFIDNGHMEGDLDESWRAPGVKPGGLRGICDDGAQVESTLETIWYDAPQRLVRFRRRTVITFPDGRVIKSEYVQQKHPVSAVEVQIWLETGGFVIEQWYGDRAGTPYTPASPRAIFWARKRGGA